MQRYYRSEKDRKIAGVCSGLGLYFKTDPVFFRVGFVLFGFMGGIGIFTYIILAVVVPVKGGGKNNHDITKRFHLSEKNKKIAGVCGGFGELFNVDPIFFRVAFCVMAIAGGAGVFLYIILWLVLPRLSDMSAKTGRPKRIDKSVEDADFVDDSESSSDS